MSTLRTEPNSQLVHLDTPLRRVLVVYAPPSARAGGAAVLGDGPVVLGRGRTESAFGLTLHDPKVSRRHATLTCDEEGVLRLVDEESRNGTYVNGARVRSATLAPGSVIRVGQHILLVQELDEEAAQHALRHSEADFGLVGTSAAIVGVRERIRRVASSNVACLVRGETGSGKERVAHALHAQSGRRGAFVPVNCASLNESLAESELFGHRAHAFTGARSSSEGLFRAAHEGTLFLDEIGDMRLPLQATLLRALDSGEIRPVGARKAETVNVRVVAATHVDLEAAVADGRFRADLYARLRGTSVELPPLREHKEDILPLALRRLAESDPSLRLSADAAEALLLHSYPYNVRELFQLVGAAAVEAHGCAQIDASHLPPALRHPLEGRSQASARSSAAPRALFSIDRSAAPSPRDLETVLHHCEGNISRAAEFFGCDRKQVYRWVERHGVNPEEFRGGGAS